MRTKRGGTDSDTVRVTLYDLNGRILLQKALTGKYASACRIANDGTLMHIYCETQLESEGYSHSFYLTLDSMGREVSRVESRISDAHFSADNKIFCCGYNNNSSSNGNVWYLTFADFAHNTGWKRSFTNDSGKVEGGIVLDISGNGRFFLFGRNDTIYSWTAMKTELWKKKWDRSGIFILSSDGQRLLHRIRDNALACDDNTTGSRLWESPKKDFDKYFFIGDTYISAVQSYIDFKERRMLYVFLDETGRELDRVEFNAPGTYYPDFSIKYQPPNRIVICHKGLPILLREVSWMNSR
jgi:hypothetical protein